MQVIILQPVDHILFYGFIDLTRSQYFFSSFCLFIYLWLMLKTWKGSAWSWASFLSWKEIETFFFYYKDTSSLFLFCFFVGGRDNMKETALSDTALSGYFLN